LQINGRLCHLVPASQCCRKIVNSRVPLLPRRYSGSQLIRTLPPPSRLSIHFRRYSGSQLIRTLPPPSRLSIHFPLFTVIESTLLQEFLLGTRRASPVARHVLVTVLSLPPRRSD
jgi:hypothetical protein